ncbi:hypothetical protein [Nonomuraea pusilla]|uniref:Uncharacterized protein n=1 Tax=Nonomuraea pusilla TaxID=46177 RepID=A0A1H7RS68_9ACTN|nr:hypothetical protein [Nonomuraea pusilla]SEL63063.1 hypothetical protein SAMN05660976_02896 [Nonomuraea pusilla]
MTRHYRRITRDRIYEADSEADSEAAFEADSDADSDAAFVQPLRPARPARR